MYGYAVCFTQHCFNGTTTIKSEPELAKSKDLTQQM